MDWFSLSSIEKNSFVLVCGDTKKSGGLQAAKKLLLLKRGAKERNESQ